MDKKRRAFLDLVQKHAPSAHVELTNSGHWRITHPHFRSPIFSGSTPSDHRAQRNLASTLRREYRLGADRCPSSPRSAQG